MKAGLRLIHRLCVRLYPAAYSIRRLRAGRLNAGFDTGYPMRFTRLPATFAALAALACALPPVAVHAQTPPPAAPAAPPAPPAATGAVPPETVLARVNGVDIRMSDVLDAARDLPDDLRSMPTTVLYPMLLDQLVDRQAVLALARKQGLDKDPQIQRAMTRATEQVLQTAVVSRAVGPTVTELKIRARYDQDIAGKPGEDEVHARHILVPTEDEAKAIIVELKKGGDFAAIAKAKSKDPGAAQGGDLGFFKKGDMVPEFADAAFALKPGQITDTPVKTSYGWHVIKVEERRTAPAPGYDQVHDELRQKMIQEGIDKLLAQARAEVKIEKLTPAGAPQTPLDSAAPPPAPKK